MSERKDAGKRMRRFWQRKVKWLFALLFLAAEMMPSMTVHAYTVSSSKEATANMELVAQNAEAELYLDKSGAMLCLVDKSSGVAVETKIMDGDSGTAEIKANQKSDFIITYFKDSKASTANRQVNYTMAISSGQMEFNNIENGVRISYDLKEDKLSLDVVPAMISAERMESLVFDHISAENKEWLLENCYRLFEGNYLRSQSSSGVTQSFIRQVQEIFYEQGAYTEEELAYDNESFGIESTWTNLEIKVDLEYVLDGKDLVVRLPMDSLVTSDEEIIVNSITLLPYMLSARADESGYFVLPDGSGAVLNFNNGKVDANTYSSRVYGKDVLMDVKTLPVADYFATMPVIGAVYEDYALLAIVEEGQSMTEIFAKNSGRAESYNNAYFTFYITEKENVATTSSTSIMVNKFTGDSFDDTIVVRYKLLTDPEDLNYTGLAHAYQEYLIAQGVLEKRQQNSALYLEILGSSLEMKTMLGFPYKGVKELTSFKEAASILEDLNSRGVSNVNVQLDGWLDGGQRHENLSSVKLESTQGNKSSFKALVQKAQELGYGLYPNVCMQNIYPSYDLFQKGSAKSYAKKYGSRYLSNEYAVITEIMYAGDMMKNGLLWSPYVLSPSYLADYARKAVKGLSKYNVSGLTVTDMGSQLVADYNEKAAVSRETAATKVAEATDILQEKFNVIMKSPYQYAWEGVDMMSDMPTRSTEYTIFDYDVPFLQLVLDGCVSYSTEPLNHHTEKDLSEHLLKCIETRSNPKFYVMGADMGKLYYTLYAVNYLSISYSDWADGITEMYKEYEAFAGKVANSNIAMHETPAQKLVKVTYDNGVIVYVNYNDTPVTVDGRELEAKSYLLVE